MQGWLEPSGGIILHLHLFKEICNEKKLSVMVFYWSSSCPLLNPLNASLCSNFKGFLLALQVPSMSQEGKLERSVRWRMCHGFTACKAPRQPTAPHLCCWGLITFSPWGQQTVLPSKLIKRKSKRKLCCMNMSHKVTVGMPEMNVQVKRQDKWWTHLNSRCALLVAPSTGFRPCTWQGRQLWNCFPHFADCSLPLSAGHWLRYAKVATDSEIKCLFLKELHHSLFT